MHRWASFVLLAVAAAAASAQRPVPPGGPVQPLIEPFGPRPQPPRPVRHPGPLPAGPVRFDRFGDRLPPGALARFGTARLRHGNDPAWLAFTPGTKYLASLSEYDNMLRLWDPATGKEVHRLDAPVKDVAFARTGTVIAADEKACKVWLPGAGAVRDLPPDTLPEGSPVLAVHPDGRTFAAAGDGPVVYLVDVQTGKRLGELKCAPGNSPINLLYSPDGRWLAATGGGKSGVWLWDLRTMKRVRTYQSESEGVDYAFSPDGAKLVVAAETLRIYSTDAEEAEGEFNPTGQRIQCPRFSSDGKSIYGLTPEAAVVRFDVATGEVKDTWEAPEGMLRPPFALAADAALTAASDPHGAIHVWDPRTGKETEVERLPPLGEPWLSPDGKSAAVMDDECRIHTWDSSTGKPLKVTELPVDASVVVTWDPPSGRAAAFITNEETEVHVIEIASGKVLARIMTGAQPAVRNLAFSPADRTRAAVFVPGSLTVVNLLTGTAVRAITVGDSGTSLQGAFSPDGRLIAATTRPLSVWEVATGKKRFDVDAAADPQGVVFSRDGRTLAAWDVNESIVVFDVRSGTILRRMQHTGADGSVTVAAFAPDGRRLATGGRDGAVSVWDVATGDVTLSLPGHEGPVTGLLFSRDGAKLLSTSNDGTALVWDMTLPARPRAAEAVVGADEALRLLGDANPAEAQRGMNFFYRHPAEAVKLLGEKVTAPAGVSAERVAKLVADLDSDDFRSRQAAATGLEAAGPAAAPALRQAAEKSASPEVRKTAADILAKLDAAPTKPDELRAVRAVEVLESIGTPAARQVLEKWAAGPESARLATEAAAALARLNGPPG
jgi:WD40 repeat protein